MSEAMLFPSPGEAWRGGDPLTREDMLRVLNIPATEDLHATLPALAELIDSLFPEPEP